MIDQNPENLNLAWVDLETFGLNPDTDPIIEVGVKITDKDLDVVAEFNKTIWGPVHQKIYDGLKNNVSRNQDQEFVWKTHNTSGLFDEAIAEGLSAMDAEVAVMAFMAKTESINLPMCGSSIRFDRKFFVAQMPSAEALFHYRDINISTVKELCRRYNPNVFAHAPKSRNIHRSMPDLEDSIAEFTFYRDEFLLW